MKNQTKLAKFRLSYTVTYTKDVYAVDEETAVVDALNTVGDESWDGGYTSQVEGEEL